MILSFSTKDLGLLGGLAAAILTGVYVLWGPESKSSKKKTGKCPGLINHGNTCFLNAVLQSFASCPSFVSWLGEFMESHSDEDCNQYLAFSLLKVAKVLCSEGNDNEDTYDPKEVLEALRVRRWVISWDQQDAHELFHVLTMTMSEEAEKFPAHPSLLDVATLEARYGIQEKARSRCQTPLLRLPSSKIDHPFSGSLASQLTCKQCGYKCPIKYDIFDSISLSLSPNHFGSFTLEALLNRFVMSEIVEDVECSGCAKILAKFHLRKVNKNGTRDNTTENIKPKATFIKQLNLGKLPQCLCIHINRRIWLNNGMPMKREDYVQFPETLNMDRFRYLHQTNVQDGLRRLNDLKTVIDSMPATPYFCNGAFHQIKSHPMMTGMPSLYRNGLNKSLLERASDLTKPVYQRQMSAECNYRLHAAVVHMGDAYSGHFVTYRRMPKPGLSGACQWLYTSDTSVRKASMKEVMSAQAYMLFYEKITR
ncbi:ubiquitin carboxyl-terminal hydrolase 30-like [Glandiceps talaboti]